MKMRNLPTTVVGLVLIGITIFLCFGFKPVSAKLRFPDGYIPLWESQSSDTISTILNTANITRITLKYDEEVVEAKVPLPRMGLRPSPSYLEVRFADGEVIEVFEPLDEFLDRIRSSQ